MSEPESRLNAFQPAWDGDMYRHPPGHPARSVVVMSAGLLARGSLCFPAFPGNIPVAFRRKTLTAYSCGGSFG